MLDTLRTQTQLPSPYKHNLSYQSYVPSYTNIYQGHSSSTYQENFKFNSIRKNYNLRPFAYESNLRPSAFSYSLANETLLSGPTTMAASSLASSQRIKRERTNSISQTGFLPEKLARFQGMKTLVLDMDETLLHSSTSPTLRPDFIVALRDGSKFYVNKRPHVDEFLERMSKLFEIVIYTAAEKDYAIAIIDAIDPQKRISYILHREHCLSSSTGLDKDLSLIGRDLRHVIFIDNLEENLRRQRDNGIKIADFYSSRVDEELKKLIPFLEYASTLDDVRPITKNQSEYLLKQSQTISSSQGQQRSTLNYSESRLNTQNGEAESQSNPSLSKPTDSVSARTTSSNSEIYLTPTRNYPKNLSQSQVLTPPKESIKSIFSARFEQKLLKKPLEKPNYGYGDANIPTQETLITEEGYSFPEKTTINQDNKEWDVIFKRRYGNGNYLSNVTPITEAEMVFKTLSSKHYASEQSFKSFKKFSLETDASERLNNIEQTLRYYGSSQQ